MLITKEVEVIVNNTMVKYYREKGYECNGGDKIIEYNYGELIKLH